MRLINSKTIIVSLGGSLIVPKEINVEFILRLVDKIKDWTTKNGLSLVFVCGGGNTARQYISCARELRDVSDTDADLMGIQTTRLNAEMMRAILGDLAYGQVIYSSEEVSDAKKSGKQIFFAGGFKPGQTSDACAVELAIAFNSDLVINTTDVDYVYDSDPKKNRDAKPIKRMTWKEFHDAFGDQHVPGMHVPFGITASKLSEKNDIRVVILAGKDLDNIEQLLLGKDFVGTLIV